MCKRKVIVGIVIIAMLLISICNRVYAVDDNVELPSSYDLRNEININVKDQGNKEWCGQYAEITMIETYIQKTRNIKYNLSVGYMICSGDEYFNNGTNLYGRHVLESDFPTKDYEFTENNKKKFNEATTKAVVRSFEYDRTILKNKEEIKKYIMNYGGVFSTTMIDHQMDNCTGTIYRNEKSTTTRGMHSVVIIGWDDNYSRNNFKTTNKPNNDGAWLILNSWGTGWGNNGTAWVSYEDNYDLIRDTAFIKSIVLKDELNAEFNYEYNKTNNTITGTIIVDNEIENIDGWSQYDKHTYTKIFKEEVEPYSIELKSKEDEVTTVVNVNIPHEVFEKQKAYSKRQEETNQKELEKTRRSKLTKRVIVCICVISFIILSVYIKLKKKKNLENEEEKPKSILYKCMNTIWKVIKTIVIVFLVIFILVIVLFIVGIFIT